jgi:hypothetical protein
MSVSKRRKDTRSTNSDVHEDSQNPGIDDSPRPRKKAQKGADEDKENDRSEVEKGSSSFVAPIDYIHPFSRTGCSGILPVSKSLSTWQQNR